MSSSHPLRLALSSRVTSRVEVLIEGLSFIGPVSSLTSAVEGLWAVTSAGLHVIVPSEGGADVILVPYNTITSAPFGSREDGYSITVNTKHAHFSMYKVVSKNDAIALGLLLNSRMGSTPERERPHDGASLLDTLTRLAGLKGSGVLTEVEFEGIKEKILARF